MDLCSEQEKSHDTPASDSQLLDKDPDDQAHAQEWNNQSAIGCLSCIQAMIHPDLTMAIQQCAHFCNDLKKAHEEAVKRICSYLLKAKDEGLILKLDCN